MNTAETREAMSIEIDAQPTTNPLDVETALPSSIVRNWPDAMWGTTFTKMRYSDGRVTLCAIGIIHETSGLDWGEPEFQYASGMATWDRFDAARALGLSERQIAQLMGANDNEGQAAAADLLESWGY